MTRKAEPLISLTPGFSRVWVSVVGKTVSTVSPRVGQTVETVYEFVPSDRHPAEAGC